jgi:hypothetical protein
MFRSIAAVLLIAFVSACAAKDNKTQVTVLLTSETQVPRELDSLEVVVVSPNGVEASRVYHEVQNPSFFPATLAVIPAGADSLKGPIRVELRGYAKGKEAQVFRRAIISYVKDRTLLLRMPLRMACFNFGDCGAGATCAGGTCQPAKIEEGKLTDFDERLVATDDPKQCFNEAACLADSQLLDLDAECTFALPEASGAGARPKLNVSIRWAAASTRVIVLDEGDAIEGWTIEGSRGRLSKGVCDSLRDKEQDPKKRAVPDQALDARIAQTCLAKQATQPFCKVGTAQNGIGAELRGK